jgi:hypothetical protein
MQLGAPTRSSPGPGSAGSHGILEEDVARYLARANRPPEARDPKPAPDTGRDVLDAVYAALTHRRFCALSRGKTLEYREAILGTLAVPLRRGEPLEFWLDIGPGYHASLRPGVLPLSFEVGLGELLMLTQVSAFLRSVASLYPPGARFRLAVDNLCALRTNDVPIERTAAYCAQLRRLIDDQGLAQQVRLFVESEEFGVCEYDALLRDVKEQRPLMHASQAEIDNVARFLGHPCAQAEALERIRLYRRTTTVTENLLARVVRGVRMTQRATPATLGFRSFPGGDARIQCGELALGRGSGGGIASILLTSRNIDLYEYARLYCASILPSAVKHITIASRPA